MPGESNNPGYDLLMNDEPNGSPSPPSPRSQVGEGSKTVSFSLLYFVVNQDAE
jgi:hypothetical protein